MGMTELEAPESSKHLIVLPGFMALNARNTVMVLARTVETATVNLRPNVTCWRTQVTVLGWPMESKEQRKHGRREMSRIKLVVGLDNGSVSVLHKDTQKYSCENREAYGYAGHDCP